MTTDSLESLVASYVNEAKRHGAAKTSVEANRAAKRLTNVYRKLVRLGSAGQRELIALLDDPDESVQCWAASHSLPFAAAQAERALQRLADSSKSTIAFTARMTLAEWKKGSMKLS